MGMVAGLGVMTNSAGATRPESNSTPDGDHVPRPTAGAADFHLWFPQEDSGRAG
jgi:hypothetical protein